MIPADAGETLDVFGPRVKFLSSLDFGQTEFTLIAGIVDPGVVVPLHSHPDRELFSITVGAIEISSGGDWIGIVPRRDTFDAVTTKEAQL
jgi:quercetin dioxygenase-like cupin family protein